MHDCLQRLGETFMVLPEGRPVRRLPGVGEDYDRMRPFRQEPIIQ